MSVVPSFATPRGSTLTYTTIGEGDALICVPGGPLLRADYLGDLGGLSRHLQLIRFNPPGSEDLTEEDAAYRCDHVAEDLESLRLHLGFERVSLLAHSAGANIALRYAEHHSHHIERLLLVTPSMRAVDVVVPDEARATIARTRSAEPWYRDAAAALHRIQADEATAEDWSTITPFTYGRWDATAVEHDALITTLRNPSVAALFAASGAFDPVATRRVLATLRAPVTVIAGEVDMLAPPAILHELVGLFPTCTLQTQSGAGHYPWVDDPDAFTALTRAALLRT